MKIFIQIAFYLTIGVSNFAQTTLLKSVPELKKNFNETGSHYIKATLVGQFWTRYTDVNPGSTLDGYKLGNTTDIGIRRLRGNVFAQVSDRTFIYVQFGQNNFGYTSKLYTGSFFHDAVAEFKVHPKMLTLGTGLTGWSGLSRFSAPGAATILGLDAPLYQQVTNGITDQFLRKLSIYGKGKIGKLDYRLIVSKPMIASNSSVSIAPLNQYSSSYSLKPQKLQYQGYLNYQFFDQEDNTMGYMTGSYHGNKKILNVGAGWIQQSKAMWKLTNTNDTISTDLLLLNADIFMELPLSEKKNTISAYVAFSDYQMGDNYIRNLGVMNPANGVNLNSTFNGSGNNYPILGTGQTLFTQIAYKFKDNLLKSFGTLQVYGQAQLSNLKGLDDQMRCYEGGINWLISGNHRSKLTLAYQSRPVFSQTTKEEITHKGMLTMQYQIAIL